MQERGYHHNAFDGHAEQEGLSSMLRLGPKKEGKAQYQRITQGPKSVELASKQRLDWQKHGRFLWFAFVDLCCLSVWGEWSAPIFTIIRTSSWISRCFIILVMDFLDACSGSSSQWSCWCSLYEHQEEKDRKQNWLLHPFTVLLLRRRWKMGTSANA